MKSAYGLAAMICACLLLFTGCSRGGIGTKMIVKALYLEHQTDYTAQLVLLQAQPSADAGDAQENLQVVQGTGNSWFEALQQAEQQCAGPVFYGQNEMFLVGPGLQENGLFQAVEYLAGIDSGRPNMQVWGIDSDAEQFAEQAKEPDFLQGLQQLSQQQPFRTFLYQLLQQEECGLVPLLQSEGPLGIKENGLMLYQQGKPTAHWTQAEHIMAALLCGQSVSAPLFELSLGEQLVQVQLSSPRFVYDVEQTAQGMKLRLHLTGAIRSVSGVEGEYSAQQQEKLLGPMEAALSAVANKILVEGFTPQGDVFGLQRRFANWNAAQTEALAQQNALWDSERLSFICELKIL